MRRERIRVRGVVQGVGFRPGVWRLARACGLRGRVWNDAGGVLIEVWGEAGQIERFTGQLRAKAPPLASVESVERQALPMSDPPGDFSIVASRGGEVHTGVVADAATCRACLEEVREPGNRRYRYPFTNCTHCGPRLSIIRSIPYDRAGTSIAEFTQCPACQGEYDDPADRRFHAQPNACAVCGPRLWLEDAHGEPLEYAGEADAVARAAALIRHGAILAVKGIGGVHLACDAANDDAVGRLRRRKRRYHKAFALMGRDLAMLGRYVRVSPLERQALLSPAAPIVVMERIAGHGLPGALAPGQNTLGFMLPYTPLHHLLMDALEGPIVLTSGNRSDEPQCIDNGESRHRLEVVADYWLLHDREIVNRLDDSVVREMAGRMRVVRRGRGYAPTPLVLPAGFAAAPPLLALGAELKNTFCLMQEGRAILSQHMGDLEEAATHREYRRSLDLYQGLFRHRPAALAVDMHPDYLSTQWGREWAAREGLELHRVQHHHAHIAACMAEQGLDLDSGPVLGVALDGLGYGADGGIWGGEFMRADYLGFDRLASFEPVAMIGGARAIHEPWRNTYAHLAPWWGEVEARYPGLDLVRFLHARPLATLDAMLERGLNSPRASSAGRLFDAVAAALGLSRETVSHEGQAAIELEALVERGAFVRERAGYGCRVVERQGLPRLEWRTMWEALLEDLAGGRPAGVIAARFHAGVAGGVASIAMQLAGAHGLEKVVLSGGVFQNRLLLERVVELLLEAGLEVLVPERSPANDGGVSLGQAVVAAATEIRA
ncbi:MAG: carbamoyltransferase HypF [gamma proteobacterium symbiont of Phacoides pectinatus]